MSGRAPSVQIDAAVQHVLPKIERALSEVRGPLLDDAVQLEVDERLAGFDEWTEWVARVRRPAQRRAVLRAFGRVVDADVPGRAGARLVSWV